MSEWNEVREGDIDIDKTEREVSIYATNNDSGSVYVVLTFDQIKKLFRDISFEQ